MFLQCCEDAPASKRLEELPWIRRSPSTQLPALLVGGDTGFALGKFYLFRGILSFFFPSVDIITDSSAFKISLLLCMLTIDVTMFYNVKEHVTGSTKLYRCSYNISVCNM